MNTKDNIPEWMQDGTEFDIYWSAWQEGQINYLQFAKAIQEVEEVPDTVKENHMRSALMIREEMNKALHVYSYLKQSAPTSFDAIMSKYDPNVRYSIVAGVNNEQLDDNRPSTLH